MNNYNIYNNNYKMEREALHPITTCCNLSQSRGRRFVILIKKKFEISGNKK